MIEVSSSPFRGHEGSVNVVRVLPGDARAVSGGADGTVRIWDLSSGRAVGLLPKLHGRPVVEIGLLYSFKAASISDDGQLAIWNLGDFRPEGTPVKPANQHISWASVRPNGRALFVDRDSVEASLVDIGQLRLLLGPVRMSPPKLTLFQKISADDQEYEAIGPIDEHRIIVTSWNRHGTHMRARLAVWDVSRNQVTHQNRGSEEHRDFSRARLGLSVPIQEGREAVVGGSEFGVLQRWELQGLRRVARMKTEAFKVTAITPFDSDRYVICGCDDGSLYLFELATGRQVGDRMMLGHVGKAIRSIAVFLDNRYAISASEDSTLRIWDLAKQKAI